MRQNRRNTMYCPEEKALEVTRTLLAANRKTAHAARKDKKSWHGRRRAVRRQEEHLYEGVSVDNAIDMIDDFEEHEPYRIGKTLGKVESDRKYDILMRREGDRLNLFFKWAKGVTDHLDTPEERLAYIREVTPLDDFMIDHSITHLRFGVDEFRSNQWSWFSAWNKHTREAKWEKTKRQREQMEQAIRKALRELVASKNHRKFNQKVSLLRKYRYIWRERSYVAEPVIRKYLGIHDIEEYTDLVMKATWSYTLYNADVVLLLERYSGVKIIQT